VEDRRKPLRTVDKRLWLHAAPAIKAQPVPQDPSVIPARTEKPA